MACVDGFARNWRPEQVPNGQAFNCILCHRSATGSGPLNAFGETISANITPGSREDFWTKWIAREDSDGDGFTNGQELGDPDGDGIMIEGFEATHPGDAESKPDFALASVEELGLERIVADRILFETDLDNLNNWEPYASVIGNDVFVIEANTFAEPMDDLNQTYALAFQSTMGGEAVISSGFFGDDGEPYSGQINASRQDGNPGRVAGDRRPGASNYIVGGEASPHAFDVFQSDNRWDLGLDRLEDGRYATVQMFSLDKTDLTPNPLSFALDAVNGRLTDGFVNGNQIGRFGGDVAVLDNGNMVVVVDDRSGLRENSNSTTAVILAPDGSVIRESWVIDPRDIWSNVTSYRGGFCVRVHDILYFHNNEGELLGQVHQVDDLPETLNFDTGRGDATRIASHINSTLVFLAGATDLFDDEGFELEDEDGQFRKGVQIAVFDAATQSFLSHRAVSEISIEAGGEDGGDVFGSFSRANLAVDALGRVAIAYEVNLPEAEQPQTLVRILSYDSESGWGVLTPSFFAFQNHSDFEIRTFRPAVAMTTKAILIAAKGEINSENLPEEGADTLSQTTFYTVFSHPDPMEDPTPGLFSEVDPIRITSIELADEMFHISWIGGVGPYQIQRKTILSEAPWQDVVSTQDQSAMLSSGGSSGFFRVLDLGSGQ